MVECVFKHDDIRLLEENYRLTFENNDCELTTEIISLLDKNNLILYFERLKDLTNTNSDKVVASLFVKRYSFSVLIALYSMSKLNSRLNFSINNISIVTSQNCDANWIPSFKFKNIEFANLEGSKREFLREEVLNDIFKENVDVVFTHINKSVGLSKSVMWENLYVYIQWMYKNLIKTNDVSDEVLDDWNYITKVAPGTLFGKYPENPLSKFLLSENRKTCCLAYLSNGKTKYCKKCPKS
ncbi:MAG: hypothetical protein K0S51_1844 [Bacillales bacterium]|jgi:ferric iron reductase protein FhuF|nr:hypothetical protein [Bacillales bacterium]